MEFCTELFRLLSEWRAKENISFVVANAPKISLVEAAEPRGGRLYRL
jgi:hypothetical protein